MYAIYTNSKLLTIGNSLLCCVQAEHEVDYTSSIQSVFVFRMSCYISQYADHPFVRKVTVNLSVDRTILGQLLVGRMGLEKTI